MQKERERILTLLENGTITAQEAVALLEALEAGKKVEEQDFVSQEKSNQQSSTQEKSRSKQSDEFINEMKEDFTQFSTKFVDFMNTAINKVKSMNFELPFGDTIQFQETFTFPDANFQEIVADIPNGELHIRPSSDGTTRVDCNIKTNFVKNEEEARHQFADKFVCKQKDQTLYINSELKSTRVNVDVYVRKQDYENISARLMNGSFSVKRLDLKKLAVKTMNGSIDCGEFKFKDVDVESANGSITIKDVVGEELEAETLNGKVYIDGAIIDTEAKSVSGHVIVTTKSANARKVKAQTVAGSVELYIPSTIAFEGNVTSNFGKMDIQLPDVDYRNDSEQLLQKTVKFSKKVEDMRPLFIEGGAGTGTVSIRYITLPEAAVVQS